MKRNQLYHSILSKPFFIDPRRLGERALLIGQLLHRDTAALLPAAPAADGDGSAPLRVVMKQGDGSGLNMVVADFNKAPQGSVAVVPLRGDMLKDGTPCTYGTEELAQLLREAAVSTRIEGIVLDVDSGGGCVDAIAPMLEAIAFADRQGKPVVACCDLCASAAYYVACHCARIYAGNTVSSEFGSIGVMTQFVDYLKYYEKEGITVHTVYSDLSNYKNAPFEAALKGDYKALREEELNPLARKFQQAVKAHRPQLDTSVEGILAGRMFFADDALRHHLIDAVGTLADAAAEARRLHADAALRSLAAQ